MAYRYATADHALIIEDATGRCIPANPQNRDYAALVAAQTPIAAYVPPEPTAQDVRAEAQRRIIALTGTADLAGCIVKQLNASMRASELINIKASGGTLTAEQTAEAAALQAMADAIKAVRAASNVIEPAPPADFTDDSYWPEGT